MAKSGTKKKAAKTTTKAATTSKVKGAGLASFDSMEDAGEHVKTLGVGSHVVLVNGVETIFEKCL